MNWLKFLRKDLLGHKPYQFILGHYAYTYAGQTQDEFPYKDELTEPVIFIQ